MTGRAISFCALMVNRVVVRRASYGRTFNGGAVPLLAGKVLGGTSSINAMYFNRGSPNDYYERARATGDGTWRYENLLPLFKKVENYQGDFPSEAHHGTDGGVVSSQKYAPGVEVWKEAGRELGYEQRDPNGPQKESLTDLGVIEYSRSRGRGSDSYTAYLKDVEPLRTNLKISRYSLATEVVLDSNHSTKPNRAVGVAYKRHGVLHYAKASKEVILAAGVYGSSQLLLRSGIGPEEDLRALPGVAFKHNLPVDRNLLDHPAIPLPVFINDSSATYDPLLNVTEDSALVT